MSTLVVKKTPNTQKCNLSGLICPTPHTPLTPAISVRFPIFTLPSELCHSATQPGSTPYFSSLYDFLHLHTSASSASLHPSPLSLFLEVNTIAPGPAVFCPLPHLYKSPPHSAPGSPPHPPHSHLLPLILLLHYQCLAGSSELLRLALCIHHGSYDITPLLNVGFSLTNDSLLPDLAPQTSPFSITRGFRVNWALRRGTFGWF